MVQSYNYIRFIYHALCRNRHKWLAQDSGNSSTDKPIGIHILFTFICMDIENPSWVPVSNKVMLNEFVFQKARAMASDFCGIQTYNGELRSTRVPMIDSISYKNFFPVITSQKHQKSLSNHWKSQSEERNHITTTARYQWLGRRQLQS